MSKKKKVTQESVFFKPGTKHGIIPGSYVEAGPKGGKVPYARKTTITKNSKQLPPTSVPNRVWKLVV